MSPDETDAAVMLARRVIERDQCSWGEAEALAKTVLALAAERRTPGTIEVCSHCRRPLSDVKLKCTWTNEAGVECPLEPFRKPPTAARELQT